jgi:hypothetical protein
VKIVNKLWILLKKIDKISILPLSGLLRGKDETAIETTLNYQEKENEKKTNAKSVAQNSY